MTNLIFDYDGTLHDSIKIYAPAFRLAYAYLASLSLAGNKEWTDHEISRWLGFSSKDMWNAFMPDLPQSMKDECSGLIGDAMLRFVHDGKAQLYPHALETLQQLITDGYTLIFLSNCKRNYMLAHIEQFHLEHYFSAFYCTEDFAFQAKYEIFNTINRDFSGEFIIIGDRFQDMEIAEKHGLKSIGCSYGYGEKQELLYASATASSVEQIVPSLKLISKLHYSM